MHIDTTAEIVSKLLSPWTDDPSAPGDGHFISIVEVRELLAQAVDRGREQGIAASALGGKHA